MINYNLARDRNLSAEVIADIEKLHEVGDSIVKKMKDTTNPVRIKELYAEWTLNEFALQKLWGFGEDINYHKSWYLPHCTCPTMDNDDAYPTGWYVRVLDCPVHS